MRQLLVAECVNFGQVRRTHEAVRAHDRAAPRRFRGPW